jgi:hypothetical protein
MGAACNKKSQGGGSVVLAGSQKNRRAEIEQVDII